MARRKGGCIINLSSGGATKAHQRGQTIPLGRTGTPDDIALVALFLASDQARYMTGHTVAIDKD